MSADSTTIPESLRLPVDAEALLPHRPPMRLVDRLISFEGTKGVVEALVRPDCLIVDADGRLERAAFVELLAQSYAAVKGYSDMIGGTGVRKGFLVAAKTVDITGEAAAGDLLTVTVATTSEVGDFSIADGFVSRGDEVLASGTITVWIS